MSTQVLIITVCFVVSVVLHARTLRNMRKKEDEIDRALDNLEDSIIFWRKRHARTFGENLELRKRLSRWEDI